MLCKKIMKIKRAKLFLVKVLGTTLSSLHIYNVCGNTKLTNNNHQRKTKYSKINQIDTKT